MILGNKLMGGKKVEAIDNSNGLMIIGGWKSDGIGYLLATAEGVSFADAEFVGLVGPSSMQRIDDIKWNGSAWVGVGYGPGSNVIYSNDPTAQSGWKHLSFGIGQSRTVLWTGTMWIIGGANIGYGCAFATSDPTAQSGWHPVDFGNIRWYKITRITYKNGFVVFIGLNDSNNTQVLASHSSDLTANFTSTEILLSRYNSDFPDIAWNGLAWVAVGNRNQIMYTYNSDPTLGEWIKPPHPCSSNQYGVAYNDVAWVVCGQNFSTSNFSITVNTSVDPANPWTASTFYVHTAYDIFWSGTAWITTDIYGNIHYNESPNPLDGTWIRKSIPGFNLIRCFRS